MPGIACLLSGSLISISSLVVVPGICTRFPVHPCICPSSPMMMCVSSSVTYPWAGLISSMMYSFPASSPVMLCGVSLLSHCSMMFPSLSFIWRIAPGNESPFSSSFSTWIPVFWFFHCLVICTCSVWFCWYPPSISIGLGFLTYPDGAFSSFM